MTPIDIEARARDAAQMALGRPPMPNEIARVLATWLCELDGAVSAGFLRRPPLRAPRPPKKPAPDVS